ncbi:MAG: response regulator [Alphaproteobacteria bacterium]|nr:response regulator [Alphaproteobacteria bacterium]
MPDRFVHIVDDDPQIREATQFLLRTHNIASQAYDSGCDFLNRAQLDRGVALLDLRMKSPDGLEVLRQLRTAGCPLPVVLASGHGTIGIAVGAMKLGATDFIEKPYQDKVLLASLERGFAIVPIARQRHQTRISATRVVEALSPRQLQILQGMVAGETNKAMARRIGISPRTVETHRAHLLHRLGAANISEAIRIANAAQLDDVITRAGLNDAPAVRHIGLAGGAQWQLAL